MRNPELELMSRLRAKSILLSARIPVPKEQSRSERMPDTSVRVEAAVIAIARAIFIEGGNLVYSGDLGLCFLLERLLRHYYLPAPAEPLEESVIRDVSEIDWHNPSLVVYQTGSQSRRRSSLWERLGKQPGMQVRPISKRGPGIRDWTAIVEEQAPVAIILIGGTKADRTEMQHIARTHPSIRIYRLATTGGAAATEVWPGSDDIRVFDKDAEELVRSFWQEHPEYRRLGEQLEGNETEAQSANRYYVPYAYVAHQIVEDLSGGMESRTSI